MMVIGSDCVVIVGGVQISLNLARTGSSPVQGDLRDSRVYLSPETMQTTG